jgi:hypothetical protein
VLETLLRISDILKDYKQLKQRYGPPWYATTRHIASW